MTQGKSCNRLVWPQISRSALKLVLVSIAVSSKAKWPFEHHRAESTWNPSPLRIWQSENSTYSRDVISHCAPLMSADGGHLMEVKLSFRWECSCFISSPPHTTHTVFSLLLVSTVPGQLLLVEVDDDLGTSGARFVGRQQGNVIRVLPEGGKHKRGKSLTGPPTFSSSTDSDSFKSSKLLYMEKYILKTFFIGISAMLQQLQNICFVRVLIWPVKV